MVLLLGRYGRWSGWLLLTFQALLNGTMWSMSTSLAAVHVAPSYGLTHVPDVAAQALLVTTFVPSRFSTCSRVLQLPDWVIQWGNRSREYPVCAPWAATVRPASWVLAADVLGMLGGARASRVAGVGAAETRAADATAMKMEVFIFGRGTVGKEGR